MHHWDWMECVMPISDLADICTPTNQPQEEDERTVRLNPRRERKDDAKAQGEMDLEEKSLLPHSEIESKRQLATQIGCSFMSEPYHVLYMLEVRDLGFGFKV